MKFVQFAASLKEELSAAYLVDGEEAYFRDHAVEAIRARCNLTQPALNETRVEGDSLKGEKLTAFTASLNTLPFLDERRLVRVYDFYPTEREWESALAPYLKNPCPTTVLVIVNSGAGKKQNAAVLRRKSGLVHVDCARESEETLSKWLFGVLKKRGLSADGDALTLMVRYCNFDAARMHREAEKLTLLLGEGGRLTRQVVEEHISKDVEYKIYELTQAASRKNFSLFSEILHDLLEKGHDENAALAFLTAHYRTLYEITSMEGSDREVAAVLQMQPYGVQKSREAAVRLGHARVQELYEALYNLSSGVKSGDYSKKGALFTAIAKIFFG